MMHVISTKPAILSFTDLRVIDAERFLHHAVVGLPCVLVNATIDLGHAQAFKLTDSNVHYAFSSFL